MTSVIIISVFLLYILILNYRRDIYEHKKLREILLAVKSESVVQYAQNIDPIEQEDLPGVDHDTDEFVDPENMDPEFLLKNLSKQ